MTFSVRKSVLKCLSRFRSDHFCALRLGVVPPHLQTIHSFLPPYTHPPTDIHTHISCPVLLHTRWGNNAGKKWRGNRNPTASINFVCAHDGFTLSDLVAYNDKHNEANGENNKDGESHNLSWNCGAEGATDRVDVSRCVSVGV